MTSDGLLRFYLNSFFLHRCFFFFSLTTSSTNMLQDKTNMTMNIMHKSATDQRIDDYLIAIFLRIKSRIFGQIEEIIFDFWVFLYDDRIQFNPKLHWQPWW